MDIDKEIQRLEEGLRDLRKTKEEIKKKCVDISVLDHKFMTIGELKSMLNLYKDDTIVAIEDQWGNYHSVNIIPRKGILSQFKYSNGKTGLSLITEEYRKDILTDNSIIKFANMDYATLCAGESYHNQ